MKNFVYLAEVKMATNNFDKNGNHNWYISPLAGQHPRAYKVAGTVALNNNFEEGTFLVKCSWEQKPEEAYDDYNFSLLNKVSNPMDVIDMLAKLGDPKEVDTSRSTDSAVDTQVSDTETKAKKIEIPE